MQQSIEPTAPAPNSARLLIEVETAGRDLLALIGDLDELTRQSTPDWQQLSQARWRAGQARLKRRMLAEGIYAGLAPSLDDREAFAIRETRIIVQELSMATAAHFSRWDAQAVENDWPTYCREAQELYIKCIRSIEAEQALLCSLIGSHPWFDLSGSQQLRCA